MNPELIDDLAEARRRIAELEQGELKYRMLVENVGTPMVYYSLDGSFLFVNSYAAANLGGKSDDFVGKSIFDVLPQMADEIRQRNRAMAQSVRVHEFEDRLDTPEGTRWFSSIGQAVRDADGDPFAIQVISQEITELKRAEQTLRELSRRLVEIQETERRRLARELHDQIGQVLTAVKLLLGQVTRSRTVESSPPIEEAQALINDLMTRISDLSLDLRPSMLDDLGLLPALKWHFRKYTQQSGIEVSFVHKGLKRRFDSQVETAAYRIVQEALTNVARHADAGEVHVRLAAARGTLTLKIEDSGAGFDSKAALNSSASSGLIGMRERSMALGGNLTISSEPGRGTLLAAELPVNPARQ